MEWISPGIHEKGAPQGFSADDASRGLGSEAGRVIALSSLHQIGAFDGLAACGTVRLLGFPVAGLVIALPLPIDTGVDDGLAADGTAGRLDSRIAALVVSPPRLLQVAARDDLSADGATQLRGHQGGCENGPGDEECRKGEAREATVARGGHEILLRIRPGAPTP